MAAFGVFDAVVAIEGFDKVFDVEILDEIVESYDAVADFEVFDQLDSVANCDVAFSVL